MQFQLDKTNKRRSNNGHRDCTTTKTPRPGGCAVVNRASTARRFYKT